MNAIEQRILRARWAEIPACGRDAVGHCDKCGEMRVLYADPVTPFTPPDDPEEWDAWLYCMDCWRAYVAPYLEMDC